MVSVLLESEYGYVVLVFFITIIMLEYFKIRVSLVGKTLSAQCPDSCLTKANGFKDGNLYICYQRALKNTLEMYAPAVFCLLIGGIKHPIFCATFGMLWILSRIAYAHGYYTGDPKNREWGSFGFIFILAMCGATLSFSLNVLQIL